MERDKKYYLNFRSSTKGQPTSILTENELESDPTKVAEGFNYGRANPHLLTN